MNIYVDALKNGHGALKKVRFFYADTEAALMMLYDDYSRLSGNRQYETELARAKTVAALFGRITQLRFAIMIDDRKTLRKLTGSDSLKIAAGVLKKLSHEYEKNIAKPERTDHADKDSFDFETTLVELSKHMGFRIDTKKTTVAEFAAMIKNYTRELELKKKKYSHGK
jgi:hypothetical protein